MGALEHLDVLIVGGGLSGIGAACHLQAAHPRRSYAILEARDATGGTWDLFRYPGIRSDSDMHTLGYRFRPWEAAKSIADGPAILEYVRNTAREHGVEERIRLNRRVVRAEFSTPEAGWRVHVEHTDTGEREELTCSFLYLCCGYFRYEQGYTPEFPGRDRFGGELIHPQHWPEDLDYDGKRVLVIGSGATAMTLVPALAERAAHVTMLQRSPTYVVAMPGTDPLAALLARILPRRLVYPVVRWKNVLLQAGSYQLSRRRPEIMKRILRLGLRYGLGKDFQIDPHFKPAYNPWDQRLCLVPDGDLFKSLRRGRASVLTDRIETFTETGVRLASGEELGAEIVVSATGLDLVPLGGIELAVDGRDVVLPEAMAYKGMMLGDVPNMIFCVGYTNASWTLKADLTSEYACRLLAEMDARGAAIAVPERDPSVTPVPFLDFSAGYVQRALHRFPQQGATEPWRLRQNYVLDLVTLRHRPIADGAMRFTSPAAAPARREPVAA